LAEPTGGARHDAAERHTGSALVSGELHDLWIYILAPLSGAAIGAFAYQLVRGRHPANQSAGEAPGADQIARSGAAAKER